MSTPLTVAGTIHFDRSGRGGRKEIVRGPAPIPAPGRIPRISRLMALAITFDGLIENGTVRDYAELARLGHVTRARVTQVMNLLLLAPDIQEELLFLPRIDKGREPLVIRDLLPIAATSAWAKQRQQWKAVRAKRWGGITGKETT